MTSNSSGYTQNVVFSEILNELNSCRWNSSDNDIEYKLLILCQKYMFSFDDEDANWKEMMFIIENLKKKIKKFIIIEKKINIKKKILKKLD